ncbi:13354_t:CDS:10 [Entrophospora sp. SA101]|nr:1582_t:CDS:10 [Entrophospora sp. SA101]CAJ0764649.1 13354_t:CDS:10 [Entrophospora sp. SA101]CAJ0827439.1 8072_t:CDS:10 [Entrophospora sp. SA101]
MKPNPVLVNIFILKIHVDVSNINNPEYAKTALQAIDQISSELREISLKIHEHPELGNQEKYAHELLVTYLKSKGFEVTPSAYGIETAFTAEFQSKVGKGKVVSFNSGIGHACGHNLIAISGVAAAIGIKSVIEKYEIEGTVKLFGTPAEESTNGKIDLIEAGAYDNVDISLMVHPGVIDAAFMSFLALRPVTVEYFGKNAHASGDPWNGINALDALISAYNNISLLRQQILPTDRNDLRSLQPRIQKCFDAASEATGTKVKTNWKKEVHDVKSNEPLATRYEYYLTNVFGKNFRPKHEQSAFPIGSTDQGNVTYVVPGIHPMYDIHTLPGGNSNHTIGFTKAAKTILAHEETIIASKGITLVGLDFLIDDKFSKEVKRAFTEN